MSRYQWHISDSFSFLFRLPPIWRILEIFGFPWSEDYWLIPVVFVPSTYANIPNVEALFSIALKRYGELYQYHYFTLLSHFFSSSFVAFFYLTLSCWTGRQQYKAKCISHWKYLPHPSSESVLFLLQLYTAQRHIHETTHNFGYFEGRGKTSKMKAKQAKDPGREISPLIAFLLKLN